MLKMRVVGSIVSRIKGMDRRPRYILLGAISLLCVLLVVAAVLFVTRPKLTETEQTAVNEAAKAASGFKKDSEGYSFTQFNKAVEFALADKCTEARAIYNEAAAKPNGLPSVDIRAYKKRIDDICSGKVTPSPTSDRNPF